MKEPNEMDIKVILLFTLTILSVKSDTKIYETLDDTNIYKKEINLGNKHELFGTNPHFMQPNAYPELNRRFVLQYPYKEAINNVNVPEDNELLPQRESPEVVLAIVKQSAMIEAAKPKDQAIEPSMENILRTGNYWNSVYREDVDPKSILRSQTKEKLESVTANVVPGSKVHKLVSILKKISPKLIYIINKKNYD